MSVSQNRVKELSVRLKQAIRMAVWDSGGSQWWPVWGGYRGEITHYERAGPAGMRLLDDYMAPLAQETTN